MKEFKDINEVLDFAIIAEQEAFEFYTSLADNAGTQEMKEVFEQFAKEEIGHKAKLQDIKHTGIIETDFSGKISDLKLSDYLVDIIAYPGMSYSEALIVAIKKEHAAYKLYMDLSKIISSSEMKNAFRMLANEESKHKLRFEVEYDENVLREN